MRKELAWLRRGAPARTSKPRFRIDAANALIANEPPPRDKLALERLATSRLGKDVVDAEDVAVSLGGRTLLDDVTFRLGPGDRIGLLGPNGAGKTTFLRVLTGTLPPDAGRVKQGKTVRFAWLTQALDELDPAVTVLDCITAVRRAAELAGRGGELTASALLERFGFTGDRLTTRVGDLSGGERRRLQLLRILLDQPNVLILDEPTNDLDVETLTVLEDFLDSWPGTLVVVTHDRYFLERATDMVYALPGDGSVRHLPRGVDQYLAEVVGTRPARGAVPAGRSVTAAAGATGSAAAGSGAAGAGAAGAGAAGSGAVPASDAAAVRAAKKDLARIERQLAKLTAAEETLHESIAANASDFAKLADLDAELRALGDERSKLEESWLEAAERAE